MTFSNVIILLAGITQFAQATNKFDSKSLVVSLPRPLNDVGDTAGGALSYNGFAYDNLNLLPLGLNADTAPQAIGSGLTGQLIRGQRSWVPINNTIKSFDEKSIAYACIAYIGTNAAEVPITCTIQVASKKSGTGNTVVQDLVCNPGLIATLTGTAMNKASFGEEFTNLTETVVTLADFATLAAVTVILFDIHAYDVQYK